MHPADVGVHDRGVQAEGEAGDRRGGVGADAGQVEQLGVAVRHLAAVALAPSRWPRRAGAGPGAGSRAGPRPAPRRRERPRPGRPASGQRAIHSCQTGSHPGDRRLLEHDLATRRRPRASYRRRARAGRAAGAGVPVGEALVQQRGRNGGDGQGGIRGHGGAVVRRSARGCWTRPGGTGPRGRRGPGPRRRPRRPSGRRGWRPAASAGCRSGRPGGRRWRRAAAGPWTAAGSRAG